MVDAIAQGGIIAFNCDPDPITIVLKETAKIFNHTGPKIVIDGGNKVTLSGDNQRRILQRNGFDFICLDRIYRIDGIFSPSARSPFGRRPF